MRLAGKTFNHNHYTNALPHQTNYNRPHNDRNVDAMALLNKVKNPNVHTMHLEPNPYQFPSQENPFSINHILRCLNQRFHNQQK